MMITLYTYSSLFHFSRRCKCLSYLPFMPTYKPRKWWMCSKKSIHQ